MEWMRVHSKCEKYATVPVGEYNIPLIGVPPSATTETCSRCGMQAHIKRITLDEQGKPVCNECKQ
jgi:transposase